MKNLRSRYICFASVIALLVLSHVAGGAKPPVLKGNPDRAKGDYVFMEAMKYRQVDSFDAGYELMSRAHELNPDDEYIGFEYGFYQESGGLEHDSATVRESIDLMKRYVLSNPTDVYSGQICFVSAMNHGLYDDAVGVMRVLYEKSGDIQTVAPMYAYALSLAPSRDSLYKAVNVLDSLEAYEGKSAQLSLRKMEYLMKLSDTTAIISEARRLYESAPNVTQNVYLLGNVYAQFDQRDSAFHYLNKAVELDPSNGAAYYQLAQYYNFIGDSVAYDREVFRAMEHPDLEVEVKEEILRGYVSQLYSDSTQHTRINQMFASLVDQYPHDSKVREMYGMFLYLVQDYAGAAEQFSYVVDINPNREDAWQTLLQLYFLGDNYDKVETTADAALIYFPATTNIYLVASSAAINLEQYDRAMAYLNRALEVTDSTKTSELASIYGAMGDVSFNMDNDSATWNYYSKALEYDNSNSMVLNNLAYYMACRDVDLPMAKRYIEQALELELLANEHHTATTVDTYAWVLFKNKEYKEALDAINEALELDDEGDSSDILEHAGDIYFMNGMPQEALNFWRQALKLDPDNELLRRKVKNKTFFFE